jgi:hypothetical protein
MALKPITHQVAQSSLHGSICCPETGGESTLGAIDLLMDVGYWILDGPISREI